jgi:phosphoglycerate dehydrogenase-like enzyme
MSKPRLLIYENAFERLGGVIGNRVEPVVVSTEGVISDQSGALSLEDANPELAWANRDLYTSGPVREFMIASLKSQSLKWFQSSAAGFEHPVFKRIAANGAVLTNTNASAQSIAEFVIFRTLEHFHQGESRLRAQRAHRWEMTPFREICATNWLVIGMGNIGRALAARLGAFEANVVGVRRSPSGDEPVGRCVAPDRIASELPHADVVVLALALNDGNRHMVDVEFLQAMKAGSVLVNIGRGGLVDEGALLGALDRGKPEFAILDVFEHEPLPAVSPFWRHPRVALSAHAAAASDGTGRRGDEIFLRNLDHYLAGEPLELVVTRFD